MSRVSGVHPHFVSPTFGMNRRAFLKTAALASAGLVLPQTTIFPSTKAASLNSLTPLDTLNIFKKLPVNNPFVRPLLPLNSGLAIAIAGPGSGATNFHVDLYSSGGTQATALRGVNPQDFEPGQYTLSSSNSAITALNLEKEPGSDITLPTSVIELFSGNAMKFDKSGNLWLRRFDPFSTDVKMMPVKLSEIEDSKYDSLLSQGEKATSFEVELGDGQKQTFVTRTLRAPYNPNVIQGIIVTPKGGKDVYGNTGFGLVTAQGARYFGTRQNGRYLDMTYALPVGGVRNLGINNGLLSNVINANIVQADGQVFAGMAELRRTSEEIQTFRSEQPIDSRFQYENQ